MANNFYPAVVLTGGGTGALDKIDGTDLADLDAAHVHVLGTSYFYTLDDDSAAAEGSPNVITPDSNAGTKRWLLQGIETATINATSSNLNITTTSSGKIIVTPVANEISAIDNDTNANSGFLVGNAVELGNWGDDGVSAGSTTITDVGGAAHGLSLAAGDLVHIENSSTAADEGFYRIVSDDGTSVVVDRTLAGSDTDLRVTFYKDVILFTPSDGTNGQRITNYSHQDKPLQIGGDILAAGTSGLGGEDVIFGALTEFAGNASFNAPVALNALMTVAAGGTPAIRFNDDAQLRFGGGSDAEFQWESADDNAHALVLALPDGGATNVPVFVIGDKGATSIENQDLAFFDGFTDPTFAVWDAAGGASKVIYFQHDGTDGVITTGSGAVRIPVAVALTPDAITATGEGVAASIATVNTEVTTNDDNDLDNVTLANGVSGQIKHIYCVVSFAGDTWKITPATMLGGTIITFGDNSVGNGCTLIYADSEGWIVLGNNGGTIS